MARRDVSMDGPDFDRSSGRVDGIDGLHRGEKVSGSAPGRKSFVRMQPSDEQVVLAPSLKILAVDSGVPEVLLAKRLLELSRDPVAIARWPVQLGRVARLRERRAAERGRKLVRHGGV